jgi:cell shape-determining protein MreD
MQPEEWFSAYLLVGAVMCSFIGYSEFFRQESEYTNNPWPFVLHFLLGCLLWPIVFIAMAAGD